MTRLCPSAPAEPGALVIGVVQEDGRVAHLATPLRADEGFLARETAPETRFRFSGGCVEGRCAQWTGSACGIIAIQTPSRCPALRRTTARTAVGGRVARRKRMLEA